VKRFFRGIYFVRAPFRLIRTNSCSSVVGIHFLNIATKTPIASRDQFEGALLD